MHSSKIAARHLPVADTLNPARGADNLLLESMQLQSGDKLLIVVEPASEQVYQPEVAEFIAARAERHGAIVTQAAPGLITDPSEFPKDLLDKMSGNDHTLFLSRIGDYCRFYSLEAVCGKTICYTRSMEMLGSGFSGVPHQLMQTLLEKFEQMLMQAKEWHIQCPLGTDIRGRFCWPSQQQGSDDEFSMALFPVTTFKPVPSGTAHGTVALSRWLLPGAAPKMDNHRFFFDQVAFADVEAGELHRFRGPEMLVQQLDHQYDRIVSLLGINRNRIHSWHTGLNPLTRFEEDAGSNMECWECISFASPRYLHFHTCGEVPPGEMAWSIFNPTVSIDGEIISSDGQLVWFQRPDNLALINQFDGAGELLTTSAPIGL